MNDKEFLISALYPNLKLKSEGNLTNTVYLQIKGLMFNYEIVPGQKLVFASLAKKLGVSRTPVNNALTILHKEGFLDFTPNQGYTVHKITKEEADALYEVRQVIETGIVDKIIANCKPKHLKLLKKKEDDFRRAVIGEMRRGLYLLDQEFHAQIVEIADNQILTGYFREIYQRIFLRHSPGPLRGERRQNAPLEHQSMVEAIEKKDADMLREHLIKHIKEGQEYVYSFIF